MAGSTLVMTVGLGLAGLGAAAVAHAQPAPAPVPSYWWCPGQGWMPGWGRNWDETRCHDENYLEGEPHDPYHWHGQGPWYPYP